MAWTGGADKTTGTLITSAIWNNYLGVSGSIAETAPAKVTTAGDLVYATGANALARLGIGTAGQALKTNSGATAPEWGTAGDNYILIVDEKAQNTDGGTFTSGAWRTRDLTSEKVDMGNNAALSSNQITLDAGTYKCFISAPGVHCLEHIIRLYNITDTSVELTGSSEAERDGSVSSNRSFIVGRFTIAAQKVFEVQHQCTNTKATVGFGDAVNLQAETYTIAEFWKE